MTGFLEPWSAFACPLEGIPPGRDVTDFNIVQSLQVQSIHSVLPNVWMITFVVAPRQAFVFLWRPKSAVYVRFDVKMAPDHV